MNKLVERFATIVAAKVADELMERLPDISDLLVKVLPQIAEQVTDQLLDRLPFPFKR